MENLYLCHPCKTSFTVEKTATSLFKVRALRIPIQETGLGKTVYDFLAETLTGIEHNTPVVIEEVLSFNIAANKPICPYCAKDLEKDNLSL